MKLSQIAEIRSGFVLSRFRAGPDDLCAEKHRLLTLGAVCDDDAAVDLAAVEQFDAKAPLSPEHLARPGDIVLRMTMPYTAVLIGEKESGIAVPSTFVIIRCKDERAAPGYLAWLLNRPCLRRDIERNTWTSVLKAVNVQYFNDLEITLPPLEHQRQIAHIAELSRREAALLRRLAEARRQYAGALLENQFNNLTKRGK